MNYRLIIFCLMAFFLSCDKEEEEEIFPIQYLINSQHRAIIENLASNEVVIFVNEVQEEISFHIDSVIQLLTYHIFEVRRGEMLGVYFTCESDYLETFKIGYQLWATGDSSSVLSFTIISGDLENTDRGQLFYASTASVNIQGTTLSELKVNSENPFYYTDSLIFGSETYRNVYTFNQLGHFGRGPISNKIVFNLENGMIYFDSMDGHNWILKRN